MSNYEKIGKFSFIVWITKLFTSIFKKKNSDMSKPEDTFLQGNEPAQGTPELNDLSGQEQQIISAVLRAPDVAFIADSKKEIIAGVSPKFCSITGYSQFEIIGKNIIDLPFWMQKNNTWIFINRLRQAGDIENLDIYITHKNSQSIALMILSRNFVINKKGYIIFSARDITHQKKKEEEIREKEALFREAQSVSNLGLWKLDLLTNHLTWSDEIFNIFEIDKVKFKASYEIFLEYIHPKDRKMVHKVFSESVEKKTDYSIIHRLLMPDGRVKYVNEHGHTVYDKNGVQQYSFGTVQDITPLKEAELEKEKVLRQLRQSQKLESIGTLTSGITHDFNNILSVIMGFTELSIDLTDNNSVLRENLDQIYEAGVRAKDLVLQILSFCHNMENKKIPIQIKMIIKESIKFLEAIFPSSIVITEKIESNSFILADPTQMHQVIMNICTNASHSMTDRDGKLHIELVDVDVNGEISGRFVKMTPGKYIKLIISDTGCGMSKETQERVFEPFFTTKKKEEGTGLGLSVVHGIIKSHNGHIMVYSEVDTGTTFSIYFPVMHHDNGFKKVIEAPLPRGNEKILVIDDEKVQVNMIKSILSSLGYEVVTMTDSQKALSLLKKNINAFDLILTDMTMPNMTGKRFAEEVKTLRSDLPVIISSGFNEGLLKNTIRKTGIKAVIVKPVLKQNMAQTIRNVLDKKE